MLNLDAIVQDERWLPHKGWIDDYAAPGMAAIAQHRAEFLEFAAVLQRLNLKGRCLQLGLGSGASHSVWSALFREAWTLDVNEENIGSYLFRCPGAKYLILGNSHDPEIIEAFYQVGPFDLLFIDADHAYEAVRFDYFAYRGAVRDGGIIAFHDTIRHPDYGPELEAWRFVEELKISGENITTIGTQLGISYLIKGS